MNQFSNCDPVSITGIGDAILFQLSYTINSPRLGMRLLSEGSVFTKHIAAFFTHTDCASIPGSAICLGSFFDTVIGHRVTTFRGVLGVLLGVLMIGKYIKADCNALK
ncbi:hypothetical protein SPRA44_610052 [Serratia proteamaculans]|nr:hypothetical protein SPRA44_610052 [Serratia proteamaculans]